MATSVARPNPNQDLAPEIRVYFHQDLPDLLKDPKVISERSSNNFFILLRKDQADALVDTTGHLYWFRGPGMSIHGRPFVSNEGYSVFADFVGVHVMNGSSHEYKEYSITFLGRDGMFSRPDWHSPRLPPEYWPDDDRPLSESLHLITGVSPENVFLFYFDEPGSDPSVHGAALDQGLIWSVQVDLNFVLHRFEFEKDTIVVQGTKTIIRGTAYIDSTVVIRLDRNGRLKK